MGEKGEGREWPEIYSWLGETRGIRGCRAEMCMGMGIGVVSRQRWCGSRVEAVWERVLLNERTSSRKGRDEQRRGRKTGDAPTMRMRCGRRGKGQ